MFKVADGMENEREKKSCIFNADIESRMSLKIMAWS